MSLCSDDQQQYHLHQKNSVICRGMLLLCSMSYGMVMGDCSTGVAWGQILPKKVGLGSHRYFKKYNTFFSF